MTCKLGEAVAIGNGNPTVVGRRVLVPVVYGYETRIFGRRVPWPVRSYANTIHATSFSKDLALPGERISIAIRQVGDEGVRLNAVFQGERRPLGRWAAMAQLAAKTGSHVNDIDRMTIWGNHSATQYPDVNHATVKGTAASGLVDQDWLAGEFIPVVQQRGAAIIQARGASSAASAASAAIDHVRDWALGTPDGDWVSMGIPADGSYGIEPGIIYSYPVRCSGGNYEIVQGLDVDDFSRGRMDETEKELREERAAIEELL